MEHVWRDLSFAEIAAFVRAAEPRLGGVRLVAVDGFAGAGKTTFATRLADELGAQVIHTDDLLHGWADVVTFWPRLESGVLAPLRVGRPGRFQRYDWDQGRLASWLDVPVASTLVVEGVTSARAAVRPELSLSVWLDAPQAVRLDRGIARDGEHLRAQWEQWQRDEALHEAADRTREHVDLVIDGSSGPTRDAHLVRGRWRRPRS